MSLTPAERYAQSRKLAQSPKTVEFSTSYSFDFDPFQIDGCVALESGKSVLVAAPTGSGKTIVGEFAAFLALSENVKCFYTTPIKALSNQKYSELVERYGSANVGLLTGDTSINTEAEIVVMTTEVLRNMLYSGSRTLNRLRYVIMDEVHYLADRFRGAVWEEVLIHLPESTQIIALSATVSNVEEFGEWMTTIRGSTQVIVWERRPVPLYQHVLFGPHLLDLFVDEGKVNPEILRLEKNVLRQSRGHSNRTPSQGRRSDRSIRFGMDQLAPLGRPEAIEKLQQENMLPVINFIFSRSGCDAAVRQCVAAGLRLTNSAEREEIREVVARHTQEIPEEDLTILGYHEWGEALSRGIAAHHAGLLPAFKECIEELFRRGLLKAVFATETLALGINMPARTVLLEKLSKWNGEAHVSITPGEYTQLTGRAGRRGIDIEGNSVILWTRDVDSNSVAGLATTRTFPLRSSFVPTYNMTVNLITKMGLTRARKSLESSFAQFQADRAVVGLNRQIQKNELAIEKILGDESCHLGDFADFFSLRTRQKELEKSLPKVRRRERQELENELEALRRALRAHPCSGCSHRERHSRVFERANHLVRENEGLKERVAGRIHVIARRFDRLVEILQTFGYLDVEAATEKGVVLGKIYGESDLLIAELLHGKLFNNLTPEEFVSVLSCMVHESRREGEVKIPRGQVPQALDSVSKMWAEITGTEGDTGVAIMRAPDFGFCWSAHRWASGHSLSSVLAGTDIAVGNFVRTMKQIIDLLRQIAQAEPSLAELCKRSLQNIDRGVVAYSGEVL